MKYRFNDVSSINISDCYKVLKDKTELTLHRRGDVVSKDQLLEKIYLFLKTFLGRKFHLENNETATISRSELIINLFFGNGSQLRIGFKKLINFLRWWEISIETRLFLCLFCCSHYRICGKLQWRNFIKILMKFSGLVCVHNQMVPYKFYRILGMNKKHFRCIFKPRFCKDIDSDSWWQDSTCFSN